MHHSLSTNKSCTVTAPVLNIEMVFWYFSHKIDSPNLNRKQWSAFWFNLLKTDLLNVHCECCTVGQWLLFNTIGFSWILILPNGNWKFINKQPIWIDLWPNGIDLSHHLLQMFRNSQISNYMAQWSEGWMIFGSKYIFDIYNWDRSTLSTYSI